MGPKNLVTISIFYGLKDILPVATLVSTPRFALNHAAYNTKTRVSPLSLSLLLLGIILSCYYIHAYFFFFFELLSIIRAKNLAQIETDTKKKNLNIGLEIGINFVSKAVNLVRTQSFSTQFTTKTLEKWPSQYYYILSTQSLDRIFGHHRQCQGGLQNCFQKLSSSIFFLLTATY